MKLFRLALLCAGCFVVFFCGRMWLHQDVGQHAVTLSWQAPASVPGVTVVGYHVYRSTASGVQYARIAERVSGQRYEDRKVRSGKTYFYAITALDQVGRESNLSPEVRAEVP
jgi:fibronectin type 3 domain-containing protein